MPISHPLTRRQKLRRCLGLYDLLAAGIAVVPALVAAGRAYVSPTEPRIFWKLLTAAAVVALLVQGRKAWMAVNKELAASDPHELRGALQVLETVLLGPDMEEPKRVGTGLRLTVYVPAPKDNETLVQVLDYVGCQRHPKAVGGKIRAGEGAVGRAYRNATLEPNRPKMVDGFRKTENYDDFVVEMTSEYGFSPERAAKLHPATMSWLAYPIAADGTVFGVLYCDSKRKDFFSEGRKRDFMHAVAGLAKFVSVRYPSKEAP